MLHLRVSDADRTDAHRPICQRCCHLADRRPSQIRLDNHDVGFKVVHTILMVVSIGVAMWAWRRRDR